jgi:signal transduction histidine kinase
VRHFLRPRHGGEAPAPRGLAGAGLVVIAALVLLKAAGQLGSAKHALIGAAVVLAAVALVVGPWFVRLVGSLSSERAQRIRQQERAELGAHLHDSVLQTLALIQKRSEDPRQVATLARRQERELREWLRGEPVAAPASTLTAALRQAAAEVEELHGVPVEVVTVGDRPLDDQTGAAVRAAREALANAARFAGAERIDVFAEADAGHAQVFVRDRGRGFDPQAIPGDRQGVRESIVGRMRRHGGDAIVRSAPGEGTEVELTL